jgi:beta-galactosidase
VYARVVQGNTLYVNTTGDEKIIPIGGSAHGVISGKAYNNVIRLKPYDADVIE